MTSQLTYTTLKQCLYSKSPHITSLLPRSFNNQDEMALLRGKKHITLGISGQISKVQNKQSSKGLTAASNTTFQGTWTKFPYS